MSNTTKKAYGYVRVGSTQGVMPDMPTIDGQKNTIKAYCRRNNIQLIDVYEDWPKSAGNLNRSGLKKMLGRLVVNPVDYIIVSAIDRLTRNMEDYFLLKERLSKLGTEMLFASESSMSEEILTIILKVISKWDSRISKHSHNPNSVDR